MRPLCDERFGVTRYVSSENNTNNTKRSPRVKIALEKRVVDTTTWSRRLSESTTPASFACNPIPSFIPETCVTFVFRTPLEISREDLADYARPGDELPSQQSLTSRDYAASRVHTRTRNKLAIGYLRVHAARSDIMQIGTYTIDRNRDT